MISKRWRLIAAAPLTLLTLAFGCSPEPIGSETSFSTNQQLVDGTPLAVGVLGFLNDASTTLSLLDDDVPLHAGAARNIIAHRDGPDGELGTSDDDPFDDVAEVLRVKQVGPARMQQITDYAAFHGWVPEGNDLLGVYDGVSFTVTEAETVLAFVNNATFEQLDDDVGLDKRAAQSIFDDLPIHTVLELSERYYVGKSALGKLKAAAGATSQLSGEGDDCAGTADCDAGLKCEGIPYDGSPPIGKCIDGSLNIPGYWNECGQAQPCNDGLECIGMTAFGGEGWCAYPWMIGTYETSGSQAIPDGDPAGVSMDVVVYGQATVPMDIVVTLYIDHPNPADLVVTLSSTNGSDSVLWNHDSSPDYYLPANGIERDNYINGTLTLHVVDTVTGNAGTLNGFKLLVSSRYD